MSDEPALLRAIVESPEDLALRMVYADWCEEHGRAARAALIRGQCFLDPLLVVTPDEVYMGSPDPRYLQPSQLAPELREDVLGPFREMAVRPGMGWEDDGVTTAYSRWYAVRRGFVEQLNLQGLSQLMDFLPHAASILARTPLLTVRLWRNWSGPSDTDHLPAELMRQLLRVDGIGRVRELDLSNYNLGEAAARALLTDADRLDVTSLRLSERSLGRGLRDELHQRFGGMLELQHSPRLSDDSIPF
jgi:uncharacterized protein (TIGR02996 family)